MTIVTQCDDNSRLTQVLPTGSQASSVQQKSSVNVNNVLGAKMSGLRVATIYTANANYRRSHNMKVLALTASLYKYTAAATFSCWFGLPVCGPLLHHNKALSGKWHKPLLAQWDYFTRMTDHTMTFHNACYTKNTQRFFVFQ